MVIDVLLSVVLLTCLYTDIRYKRIYNIITFPAAVVAIITNISLHGLSGGSNSIKGLLLGISLLFVPFAMGGIGAGDVKLLGIIGAFKGPEFVWRASLYMAITGGLVSVGIMARSKNLSLRLKAVFFTLLSLFGITPKVNYLETIESTAALTFPYGIAITAGTVMAYLLR